MIVKLLSSYIVIDGFVTLYLAVARFLLLLTSSLSSPVITDDRFWYAGGADFVLLAAR
jgi:hypothetical protein